MQRRQDAVPSVRTIVAKEDFSPRTIELTGNMAAFDSATLFARATGYIKIRNADIGTRLKKGEVLAVIAATISTSSCSKRRDSWSSSRPLSSRPTPTPISAASRTSAPRGSSHKVGQARSKATPTG